MSGVIPAVETDNHPAIFGQIIDDFAFAFVSPLRANNNKRYLHIASSASFEAFPKYWRKFFIFKYFLSLSVIGKSSIIL